MASSSQYNEAEELMITAFSKRLRRKLTSQVLMNGTVQVDGVDKSRTILVEAYAGQKTPKPGSKRKVITDAFKLTYAAGALERETGNKPRMVLLFCSDAAAAPFKNSARGWIAFALDDADVSVEHVSLSDDDRKRLFG